MSGVALGTLIPGRLLRFIAADDKRHLFFGPDDQRFAFTKSGVRPQQCRLGANQTAPAGSQPPTLS